MPIASRQRAHSVLLVARFACFVVTAAFGRVPLADAPDGPRDSAQAPDAPAGLDGSSNIDAGGSPTCPEGSTGSNGTAAEEAGVVNAAIT